MINEKSISIIIPVYNTEKYLSRCLDSILFKCVKDIEVVIINDCSPGNCKDIVEKYQKKYSNINYIELKKNSGTLIARDTGIKSASSKYIMCVDPDDYLEKDSIKELLKELEHDYDIIVFNHICENENGERFDSPPQNRVSRDMLIIDNVENMKELFSGQLSESMIKVIKKTTYQNINLDNYNIIFQEDYLVITRLIYYSKSIKYIAKPYYIYFQRKDSATRFKNMSYEKKKKILEDLAYVNKEVSKFLENNKLYRNFKSSIINREHTYKEWMYDEMMLNASDIQKKELDNLFSKAFRNIKKTSKMFSLINTNKYITIYLLGIKVSIKK